MPGITHHSNMNGYGESSRYDRDFRHYGMNGSGFDPYSTADPLDYASSRRPQADVYRGGDDNFPSSRHPDTYRGIEDYSSSRRPDTYREENYSSSRRPLTVGDGYGAEARGSEFRLSLPHDLHSPRDDHHDNFGRTNNGFSRDIDQGSLDGMRGASFEVDHLATFTSSKDRPASGPITFEDGLRKLKNMEVQSGVWTMRCELVVEPNYLVINDKGTGEEYERFPMHHVHDPVAVLKDDSHEVHSNLILFTVCEDPKKKYGISDMHIFQCVERHVRAQEIVDEILGAKEGRRPMHSGPVVPPPPMGPAPNPPHLGLANWINRPSGKYQFYKYPSGSHYINGGIYPGKPYEGMSQRPVGPNRASYIPPVGDNDMDSGLNERLEKNVQLLNFCFDDIEKFVSRLQAAAEAYKELERRRRERSAKKMKNRPSGEGLLNMKARPPPADDFVDIFQKFKFAFNLLSDLKAHIHDPNAPELVHFLFTPLSLIYEASRDPVHGGVDLADNARSPLITAATKELLLNCLTSKELELWQALGRHWTNSREDIKDYVEPYNPRFYNGISPSPATMPVDRNRLEMAVANMDHQTQQRARDFDRRHEEVPFQRDDRGFRSSMMEDRGYRSTVMDDRGFRSPVDDRPEEHLYARSTKPAPALGASSKPNVSRYQDYVEKHIDRNKNAHQPPADNYRPEPPSYRPEPKPRSRDEENKHFQRKLASKNSPLVYEVVHDREGRNDKEITVLKGDIVEVLDNQRNWWKIANCYGKEGYAPYTILRKVNKDSEIYSTSVNPDRARNSGEYNSYIPQSAPHHNIPEPPPIDSARMGGARRDSPRDYDDNLDDRRRNFDDDRSDKSSGHRIDDSFDERYSDDDRNSADRYRQDFYDRQSNDNRGNGDGYSYENNRDKFDRYRSDYSDRESNDGDRYSRDNRPSSKESYHSNTNNNNRRHNRSDDGYDDRRYNDQQMDRKNERYTDRDDYRPGDGYDDRRNDFREQRQVERRDDRRREDRQINRRDERMSDRRNNRQMDREERHAETQSVPPPPPPTSRPPALKKVQPKKQERPKSPKNDLHSELVKRVSAHNLALPKSAATVYVSKSSDPEEVQEWLQAKGFSRKCADILSGYTGDDLFQMRRAEMNRLLGQEEGHRLESLVTVQKKISNYETVNPGKVELRNILQERKKRAEKNTADTGQIHQPPAFAPESPDYSDNESDSSEDDFANAGKTLRALLQQQRRRIHKSTYEQH